ncbi:MAG: hypothetical protein AB1782_07320 [Cyanobacteriota bacterium]
MDYPKCHLKCNGLLNCQQLDHLLMELVNQNGREEVIDLYKAMLIRNFKHCPMAKMYQDDRKVVSMY